MFKNFEIDTYAVFGNPIKHSKSPDIHEQFARQTEQVLQYHKILVEIDKFSAEVKNFREQGGKGLNITVPFKQQAWALCDNRSERAEQAEAVNTIFFDAEGKICGDNTDGIGMVRDMTENHQVDLAHKNILILGAGGAVRGVILPLLQQQPNKLRIANRTLSKAEALVKLFNAPEMAACAYTALAGQQFDVIINATSAGLHGELPPVPDDILTPGGLVYDMVYANEATAFVRWGREHDAGVAVDGLGMLVEQAAEAFYIWRGTMPDTAPVIASLRGASTKSLPLS
jgi:shikimate dehydrogenase